MNPKIIRSVQQTSQGCEAVARLKYLIVFVSQYNPKKNKYMFCKSIHNHLSFQGGCISSTLSLHLESKNTHTHEGRGAVNSSALIWKADWGRRARMQSPKPRPSFHALSSNLGIAMVM